MTDKVIHVNVTSTKSQRVSVSPGNVQNEITATPDSSQYYSNLAKNWAIGAGLILNEDYSSKHYAGVSENNANVAKNYADATQATYQNVQQIANTALTDIEDARVDAIDNITTVKSESIASVEAKANEANALVNTGIANINTAKTEAVNAVTTTKNNAVTEINKEVTDGKKELNDIIEAGGLNINDKLTNCLLEVPQKIKLELKDGVLTLKAGSKVIVPNGVGVFDELVIDTDRTLAYNWGGNEKMLLFLEVSTGKLTRLSLPRIVSGTTNTYTGSISHIWYNTTTNKVNWINNDGSLGIQLSLPFALFTAVGKENGAETPKVASIDQVFNGIGYIGSTVFVDKGVKGLIPNGRNADGTLKNIEFTTPNVLVRTFTSTFNTVLGLKSNYIGQLTLNDYSFDYENNYCMNTDMTWEFAIIGSFTQTNGVISSFQPKLPVRLLTYDDIKINNPYFFGQYIWSEFAPSNLSWLKSSGQWNSGSGYQAFYDWALANANANKTGFKLSTASYTDYDFVVNTSAKTFRLPIKVQNTPLNDSASVVGNGLALGLNSGTVNFGMVLDNGSSHNYEIFKTGAYGASTQGTAYGNAVATPADYPIGVTTDPTKSGLVANLSANTNVSLYFYVGETTRDTGLINASQIASNFADKIGRTECKAYITETYRSGTSWYRVWSDGWCEQGGHIASGTVGGIVTLLKPYVNTNYDVFVAPSSTGDYFTANIAGWANSKTQFNWNSYNNSATPKIWRTNGYIN